MDLEWLPLVLTAVLLCGAVYTDLRRGRIYNYMTIPALVTGLVLSTATHGWPGLRMSVAGVGVALVLWVLSGVLGRCLGGGDIKLLAAIGALCGAHFMLASFVLAVLAGGVMAAVTAARRGELVGALRRCVSWGTCRLGFGQSTPLSLSASSMQIPYAVPIAIGVVLCLVVPAGVWAP